MIQRKFVRTRQLKPGMRLDHPVVDRMGRSLVARGAALDDYMIEALLKLGIMSVYIQEGELDESEFDDKICEEAKKQIEKLHTEDKKSVKLTESVKKRVSEGVQYLYNHTEADNFLETTKSVTTDLLDVIDRSQAIAIDINSLKTSDEYTFKHSVDVATIAMILGKQQKLTKREIYELGVTGLLHDIGKTKIPNEILNKPGKLNDAEFLVMRQHSVYGFHMLQENPELKENHNILYGVLQHHEKMDSSGYPMKVSGEKIVPYAKIISVADIYDALVTERPYKAAFSQREAVEMIMSMTEELDMTALQSFLDSAILYPVDSMVELSNGEMAKVVKNTPNYILRPVVVGISDGKVYDLANDLECAKLIIT